MSERGQVILVWWGWIFMAILGISYYWLIGFMPPPPATLSAEEVAAIYQANSLKIRIGAMICSWVSACMVPIFAVVAVQLARAEKGIPIWSILQFGGGMMMTIFLVLPPIMWGTAAFSPDRPAEVTLLMHEFANLTLVTTDQYFIFQMVPIAYVSLTQKLDDTTAFPRWFAYVTIWVAIMFEVGALGFIPRTGPFAWNGLFVFWLPLILFGSWVSLLCWVLLRAIRRQQAAAAAG